MTALELFGFAALGLGYFAAMLLVAAERDRLHRMRTVAWSEEFQEFQDSWRKGI